MDVVIHKNSRCLNENWNKIVKKRASSNFWIWGVFGPTPTTTYSYIVKTTHWIPGLFIAELLKPIYAKNNRKLHKKLHKNFKF